jgi:hypothetical protein
MLYLVIERFKPGAAPEIYRRACEQGRLLPDGLEYAGSWVDLDFTTCYQLMQTEQPDLFQQWFSHWQDLVDFELVPVRTGAEAAKIMQNDE